MMKSGQEAWGPKEPASTTDLQKAIDKDDI